MSLHNEPKNEPKVDNVNEPVDLQNENTAEIIPRKNSRFWDLIPVWLYSPLRYLFGRDVFVSYSRHDAGLYATHLVLTVQKRARKQKRKLSFYLDKWIAPPDGELPKSLKRQLRWSSTLVVICTKYSVGSPFVKDEISHFANLKRKIIFINVDNILSDGKAVNTANSPWKETSGAFPTAEVEDPDAFEKGRPSSSVINRILKSTEFTTQDQRLLRSVWGTLGFILLFTGGAFAYNYLSIAVARKEAVKANESAQAAREMVIQSNSELEIAQNKVTQAYVDLKAAQDKETAASDRAAVADVRAGTAETKAAVEEQRALKATESAKKADADRVVAEGKATQAQELAAFTDEQERASRGGVTSRQPGREFEGLGLALEAATANFKRPQKDDKVIDGLTTTFIAADFALPLKIRREKITFAQISPDGKLLFVESAHADSYDRKWEIFYLEETKDPLLLFDRAPSLVRSVSFARNNSSVAVTIDNAQTGNSEYDAKGKRGLQIWDLNDPGRSVSFDLKYGLAALDDKGEYVAMIQSRLPGSLYLPKEKLVIKKVKFDDEDEDDEEDEDDADKNEKLKQPEVYPISEGISVGAMAFGRDGSILLDGIVWEGGKTYSNGTKLLRLTQAKTWTEMNFYQGGTLMGVADDDSLIFTAFRSRSYNIDKDELIRVDSDGHIAGKMSGFNGEAQSTTLTNPPRVVVLNGGKLSVSDTQIFPNSYSIRGLGQGLGERTSSIAFSPQGQFMASSSFDSLNVWKTESGKIFPVIGAGERFQMAAFTKDNSRIAAFGSTSDKVFKLWDISTGKTVHAGCESRTFSDLPRPTAMAFLNDDKLVATALGGGMLIIWDAATCLPVKVVHLVISNNKPSTFQVYNGYEPVNFTAFAAFSTDGKTLITASQQYDYNLRKYIVGDIQQWELGGDDLYANSITVKPDEINTSLINEPFRLLPDPSLIQNMPGQLLAMTYGNEFKFLLRGQIDGTLQVIGRNGKMLAKLKETGTDDTLLAYFSSDGQRIITASKNDQTVKIWNANNGDLILQVRNFIRPFNSVAISANGERFAVGDDSGTVRVYPTTAEEFYNLAANLVGKNKAGK